MSEEAEVIEQTHDESGGSEDKAREMGWSPQEEWRGDPEKWVDADEFLERGEKSNAILRERNDKLLNEVTSLKTELRNSVREFGEANRKTEERAYMQALKDIQGQQREAVSEGDAEKWERLEKEKAQLSKEHVEATKPKPQGPDDDPVFKDWHGGNSWYGQDVKLTAYAEQIAPVLLRRHNGAATKAFYDEVALEVKKEYPDRFRNTNRDHPGAMDGGVNMGGKGKKGKSYSDLPPEAKAACDKFVKQGLMKKEEYVKDYFGE